MRNVEYVDLPTGHWPQFTKPKEVVQALHTGGAPGLLAYAPAFGG